MKSDDEAFFRDYQMLSYFQEEFTYRHKHFWNVLTKSFLLTITITIIPVVSEIGGLKFNDVIRGFLFIFPIAGAGLAIGGFLLLWDEGKKMNAVNIVKYRINQKMPSVYHYFFYDKFSEDEFRNRRGKKRCPLAKSLAVLLLVVEISIISIVFIMLLNATNAGEYSHTVGNDTPININNSNN